MSRILSMIFILATLSLWGMEAKASDYVLDSIATFTYPSAGNLGGSGCWGYKAPDGTQYGIMGVRDGVAIININTRTSVQVVPGPKNNCSAYWREMRTYQHYAYIVSECIGTNQGLMILDLQYLPDSVKYLGSIPVNNIGDVTSHTISIDSINGYMYLEGRNQANLSIHVHSLANPAAPVWVHSFGDAVGIHDMTATDDTIYVADGWSPTVSIYDMAVKTAPVLISRFTIPSGGYVHNVWPTDDRTHLVTTEETTGKTVKIFNIEDLQNVQLVGQFIGGSNVAHNAYCRGDWVILSHYAAGFEVWDISTPALPTRVANFDTWPTTTGFDGLWGAYAYADSGYIWGSNLNGKFYIVQLRDTTVVADADNDGIPNSTDNCRFAANPGQEDLDGDLVGDVCDNCVSVPNPLQEDSNLNGVGDACDQVCGDVDQTDTVTISDVVYLIEFIFAGGPAPSPLSVADVNCDSQVTVSDVVYIINFIFAGGSVPCALCP